MTITPDNHNTHNMKREYMKPVSESLDLVLEATVLAASGEDLSITDLTTMPGDEFWNPFVL